VWPRAWPSACMGNTVL